MHAINAARHACMSRVVRQTCQCARLASPVLRTCPITTTRYGRSRNPTAKQPTWLLLVQVPPRNCQTRPHCGSLTTAELAVVGMLCCGVSLYRAAAGHQEAQGVAKSGASCSRDRRSQLLCRDNIEVEHSDLLCVTSHTFNGCFKFKHHLLSQ